jgi:hypothetical protein
MQFSTAAAALPFFTAVIAEFRAFPMSVDSGVSRGVFNPWNNEGVRSGNFLAKIRESGSKKVSVILD